MLLLLPRRGFLVQFLMDSFYFPTTLSWCASIAYAALELWLKAEAAA